MTITIYDINSNPKAEIGLNEGAKGRYTLGSEDIITLPFNVAEPIVFSVGDYVDLTNTDIDSRFAKKYIVAELPSPTYDQETGGYHYDLQLKAYYYAWANLICKYTPRHSGKETAFSLVDTIGKHMSVVLQNLSEAGYTYGAEKKAFEYSATGVDANLAKLITYSNTNIIDALTAIAEAYECEWWVEGNKICFGRKEQGDIIPLELGVNVSDMSKSDSKGTYATRLYVFGSERNIPRNYRKNDNTDLTVGGIVVKRLMIPSNDKDGNALPPYIDAYRYREDGSKVLIGEQDYEKGREMSAQEAIEAVITTDEIYPQTKLAITSIHTYEDYITDDDGNKTDQKETFYQFTTNGYRIVEDDAGIKVVRQEGETSFTFDKSFLLGELNMKFTGGKLNGFEFAVNYTETGVPQLYEIVANETYQEKLPNTRLCPQVGDTFVLTGWNAQKMDEEHKVCSVCGNLDDTAPSPCPVCGTPDSYADFIGTHMIETAEQELYDWGVKQLTKIIKNEGTYNTILMSDYAFNEEGAEPKNRAFDIGQRVKLINGSFFATPKQSRIIGYEINLDLSYDAPIYIIGESVEYSRLGAIEENLEEISMNGQSYLGASSNGSGVYLITTNDSTTPSENNAYSAKRSDNTFLSKTKNDKTEHHLSVGGLLVGKDSGDESLIENDEDAIIETSEDALVEYARGDEPEPTPSQPVDISEHTWGEMKNVAQSVDRQGNGLYAVSVQGGMVSLQAIEGKTFMGVVESEGFVPISARYNGYYLVATAGSYTHFGGREVGSEHCGLFVSNGTSYDYIELNVPQSDYVASEFKDIRQWMHDVSQDIDVVALCESILGVGGSGAGSAWVKGMEKRMTDVENTVNGIGTLTTDDIRDTTSILR